MQGHRSKQFHLGGEDIACRSLQIVCQSLDVSKVSIGSGCAQLLRVATHWAVDGLDAMTWQASLIKAVRSQTAKNFRDRLRSQVTKRWR